MTPSVTEDQIMTALRAMILAALPTIVCIQGQANRVAEPGAADFIVMTPTTRVRLSTNVDTFAGSNPTTQSVLTPVQVTIQCDVHGPTSSENAHVLASLLSDQYASSSFAGSGFDVAPLYAADPRQLPFLNGENAYENRWSVDVVLQANPVLAVPQDFASTVQVTPEPVDA